MLALAAALVLAGPTHAFDDLSFARSLVQGVQEIPASKPQEDAKALASALGAMQAYPFRPGSAVSPQIVEFLRWARVDFHDAGPHLGYGYIRPEGYPAYYLLTVSRALKPNEGDRFGQAYLAAALADGASRLLEMQQPESAEREHMRLSRKVRVWIEMNEADNPSGGEPWMDLEALKAKDGELADYLSFWIEHCGPYGSKACDAETLKGKLKKPTVKELLAQNTKTQSSLQAQLAKETGFSARYYREAIERAKGEAQLLAKFQKSFDQFRQRELDWGRFQKTNKSGF